MDGEILLKKYDKLEVGREIKIEEAKELLQKLSNQFDIDIINLVRDVASNKVDGFSINKDRPYAHLYIGNGSDNVSIKLMTSEKEINMKVPKSSLLI